MSSMFWFFTYRLTVIPILIIAPVLAVLGAIVPLLVYRVVARQTIVERLREQRADDSYQLCDSCVTSFIP